MYRFLTIFCLLLYCAITPAFAGDAIVTSQVSVDVTGQDAADARTQAMARGEINALISLLSNLTPPGQAQDIVSTLDSKKITAMVRGVEVLEEKMSDNRYRAQLIVSFDATSVSNLIGKFTANAAKEEISVVTGSFLILPAYEEEGLKILWGEENAWYRAWTRLGLEINAGDIIVPYGDHSDASIVNINNISSATYSSLTPLASRYGTTDIVILQAKYSRSPEIVLNVVKRRINRIKNEVTLTTYRADPQENRDTLLARAARDIADNMKSKKIEEISEIRGGQGGERHKIMLLASISTLRSWTDLRSRLSSLPMIERTELLAMSPKQVDMAIYYRGKPESLAAGIVAKKLRLVKYRNYWVVSRD